MITIVLRKIIFLTIIKIVDGGDRVRFLAFDKCSTTNEQDFVFNVCEIGPKGANVSYTVGDDSGKAIVS